MSGGGGSSGWNGGMGMNPGGGFQGPGARGGMQAQAPSAMNMNQALQSAPGQFTAAPGQISTGAGGGQTPLTPPGNTWGGNQGGVPGGYAGGQMPNFSALNSLRNVGMPNLSGISGMGK
jgi:hypothetical protein